MQTLSMNHRRWLYALSVLLVIIAVLYLGGWVYGALRACSNILALYFTAWLLQFFFTPVVDFMVRHRLPRLAAVIYVYLLLALVLVIAGVALFPSIYSQGRGIATALGDSSTYNVIRNVTNGVEQFLVTRLHVPEHDVKSFIDNYSISFNRGAINAGRKLQSFLEGYLKATTLATGATTVVTVFNTISSAFVNAVIVLILAFYMTLDGPALARRGLKYFPPVVGEIASDVHVIVNRKFAGYLRGQIILAASYGLLTYVIASSFQLPYSVFIAIFAAIMMLIPFIGTIAALVPPIVFFVVANPAFPLPKFLLLLALLIASQQLVLNLLAPRVMGSAVGMHPLLVVLGLLLGIKFGGLWGAIFGVPIFGVILDTVDLLYRRIMHHRFNFRPFEDDDAADTVAGAPGAPVGMAEHVRAADHPEAIPRVSASAAPPPGLHDLRT